MHFKGLTRKDMAKIRVKRTKKHLQLNGIVAAAVMTVRGKSVAHVLLAPTIFFQASKQSLSHIKWTHSEQTQLRCQR